MENVYVVHLTPARGMQASARIARFLSTEYEAPLLDTKEAIDEHFRGNYTNRDATLLFVNGAIAFSGIREELAEHVLPFTKTLVWVQNDYTIQIPANPSISGPSKADLPFRRQFGYVPQVKLWSTCEDVIKRKGGKYVDWNKLTYAPFQTEYPSRNAVFYYGALRENRKVAFNRLLNSLHIQVSVSRSTTSIIQQWKDICPDIKFAEFETEATIFSSHNENNHGEQPLLSRIAEFRHSVYIGDDKSNDGSHSLANRFYEVLSTPYTVLWLDAAGAKAYEKFGLENWKHFTVSSNEEWDTISQIDQEECIKMAKYQRQVWLQEDPYHQLRKSVGL